MVKATNFLGQLPGPRRVRNAALARHLGVTEMTIWRWQRDVKLGFPPPSRINGICYTDLDDVDAWWKSRIVTAEQLREKKSARQGAALKAKVS